jgi:hypothetical protein
MTNREYLRNLLTTIASELAAIAPGEPEAVSRDIINLTEVIDNARAELDKLDPESLDESYQVKPLYDRIKAIVVHERIVRNSLDRIALSSQSCLEACNRISEQVEQDTPPEDDAL